MNVARPLQKARIANSSATAFPSWTATEFDPAFGDPGTAAGRVIYRLDVKGAGGVVPCAVDIFPYGLGSDNDVFDMNVIGYRRIGPPVADHREQWLRFLIAKLTCTISTAVGVANGNVIATERFADTIAITVEGTYTSDVTRSGSILLYSPANNNPAHAVIPLLGCQALELEFDPTTGTPTMNALLSFLDSL